jgi:hypothetical protein
LSVFFVVPYVEKVAGCNQRWFVMKKQREQNPQNSEPAIIYCTECGAELENFCFSGSASDLSAIKKTLAQCKKEGRLVGDFCSKLFIAETQGLDDILKEVEELRSRHRE